MKLLFNKLIISFVERSFCSNRMVSVLINSKEDSLRLNHLLDKVIFQ